MTNLQEARAMDDLSERIDSVIHDDERDSVVIHALGMALVHRAINLKHHDGSALPVVEVKNLLAELTSGLVDLYCQHREHLKALS